MGMGESGGCSSVVRELEFKSEDPGSDPLVGQGEVRRRGWIWGSLGGCSSVVRESDFKSKDQSG